LDKDVVMLDEFTDKKEDSSIEEETTTKEKTSQKIFGKKRFHYSKK